MGKLDLDQFKYKQNPREIRELATAVISCIHGQSMQSVLEAFPPLQLPSDFRVHSYGWASDPFARFIISLENVVQTFFWICI